MKIYTIHSPSHQKYFDLFKDSLNGRHEIVSRKTEQVSNPHFGSKTIKRFYYLKVLYILEALYRETEPFIFSDVDVYFFRDFHVRLDEYLKFRHLDFLAQYEKRKFGFAMVCSGFMALKPSKRVRRMFLWILKNLDRFNGDQEALNAYLLTHPFKMRYDILPQQYYSINFDNGNKVWDGEEIHVSMRTPVLLHYHWTIGDENRMKLLEMVKRQVCETK